MKGRVTKTGYRRNSPDVNNDYNVIPSNRISMAGVDFPVLGIDNLGNSELMYPGGEYEFQGDYVTELPAFGSGGLTQWFAEEWVDIKTGKKCGRSGKDKNGRPYPACRPSKRVNSTTPKTSKEMSAKEKAKFKKSKTSGKRINYNHKRAQEGIEVKPASRRIRYEDGRMKLQDPAIYDGMLDETTVTPYTQSELAFQEGRANLATGGLEPAYPIFDVMTLGLRTPATAGAKAIQAGIKKAPSKINPRYFQPNSNMYYRGIGRGGMEDALESGLFRAKPSDKIPARMVDLGPNLGKLDMAKRFNKTYYSPRFNIADQYGAGYIAEVPKDAAKFSKRYKNTDWSMSTRDQIPVSEGQILKKDWWSGYKPVKSSRKSLADNFNLDAIESAYAKNMSIPAGANMSIADDVFSGNTLYGKGAAFTKEEALGRIANFQKDLSPVPFTYTHGTGSKSLPGVFKNKGLIPSSKLEQSGDLLTGEMLVKRSIAPDMYSKGQNTVSTASIANPQAAAEYAIEYGQGAGNYPIVFGINPKVGARSRMSIPSSTIEGEAMFSNGIELDEISNIFVPDAQRASFIKNYGEQLGNIKLGSFDDYVNQAQSMGRRKIRGAKPYLYQTGREVKGRMGVRANADGTKSTHLMAREYIDGKGWVAFPTLFQNSDSSWVDMSKDKSWYPVYEEAMRRGEVYEFGEDLKAAKRFADEGSWKKEKYQTGREVGPPSLTPGPIQDKVYPMVTGPVEDSLENRIASSTPVKPGKESSVKMQSSGVDVDRLRKGIKYAESLNGKLMMNPESTATGFYGQLFSEVKGKQFLKDIDRKTFAADTNLQNQVFDERLKGNEELFGIKKGLIDNGMDIYNEYKPILKDKLKYSPTELAALSNMLGRQGAREYVGYVLRDGKTLAEALPNIYGPNAKYKNHTPEEYIEKFNKAFNSQKPEVAKPKDTSKGPAGNVTMGMDIYDYEEGGESLPDYTKYDSEERAWFAARKELGKGKMFMYGGQKYTTSTPKGL